MSFSTLLLDTVVWDLVLDAAGNIARADPPYAVAQDVASAQRLFLGELWYDQSKGIPYFEQILGNAPAASVFEAFEEQAALSVPSVVTAQCQITQISNRGVSGQTEFQTDTGATGIVPIQ